MQLFTKKLAIDFMRQRKLSLAISIFLVIVSVLSLSTKGLNLGIDFTGGYLIEVGYKDSADLKSIRAHLKDNDYADAQVQHFGTSKDVLVRLAPRAESNQAALSDNIFKVLKQQSSDVTMRRVEFVGPQIGEELREQGGMAMLIALFGILIYVSFRFQLKSALGAIFALIHDVIITLGVFSLIQMSFDLSVLAAILAVIGYSLNDTVVVLDRIRESFRTIRKKTPGEIINISINSTLSRTVITSLTTLLVLMALFYFGGEVIHGFAFALIVGVLIGTYSSIFIASSTLMLMNVNKQDFLESVKEDKELDELP
ncbi:MAG: protein translocase subunit SecF [Gammaproteobacteria bacterium]|nr:protein translocase subunit SecF [Gammaproteobacteria bacterium]